MIVINDRAIALKPYSIGDLARIYNVDYRTLKKWIREFEPELGKKVGRFYTITQVEIIFDHLRVPAKVIAGAEREGKAVYIDSAKNLTK